MLTEELQIAERARKHKQEALTNLHQFIDVGHLEVSYRELNKKSVSGVDGEDWYSYQMDLSQRLSKLLSEFKGGSYRAPAIRRVYIPKNGDGKRPIGISTTEDKILQGSISRVLNPIYEEEFKDCSYGFRRGRSAHQAIEQLYREVSYGGMHYIIDADIKSYFDNISHGKLRGFLDLRVKDGKIRKMIDKWLKAGILEDKSIRYPKEGTPQGGLISPLLSNIYLHYVLDEWFIEQIQPLLSGKSFIIRYADDFILGFENIRDAKRVLEVLPKRFGKFNLELHEEKTKLIDLHSKRGEGERSFEFLGFSHYLGRSRKGKEILKRKTSSRKLNQALKKISVWIKKNRHRKLTELIAELNLKLRGHYNFYGITFNSKGIMSFYDQVRRILQKWLNRRGGNRVWNWDRYEELINNWIPLLKPKIYHSYR